LFTISVNLSRNIIVYVIFIYGRASKETGMKVNDEKTKFAFMSRDQNAGQNHNIKRSNKSFESVAKLK
jgi:hypothetical protein